MDEYNSKSGEAAHIVENDILNIIQNATDAEFIKDINIDARIRNYNDLIEGTIKVKYGGPSRTEAKIPLSWSWNFRFDHKSERTANSWSGLAATTQEDIDILKKSISTLEALASITDDYIEDLISKNTLNYYDYVTQEVEDGIDSISYIIKKLEALIGTGYYISIVNDSVYEDYLRIDKVTSKQFNTTTVRVRRPYSYNDERYPGDKYVIDQKRYSKDKLAKEIEDREGIDFDIYSEDDLNTLMNKSKNY